MNNFGFSISNPNTEYVISMPCFTVSHAELDSNRSFVVLSSDPTKHRALSSIHSDLALQSMSMVHWRAIPCDHFNASVSSWELHRSRLVRGDSEMCRRYVEDKFVGGVCIDVSDVC